jgi:hypothetical protein
VILTLRAKFKVVKFRAAPLGTRNSKGDFVISLTKTDRVRALTQIVRRPTPLEVAEVVHGTNGASQATA